MRAAKEAGVQHFIWSTLPDAEAISGGKLHVPHFTGKAKIDRIVKEAGFAHHTFVIAPFFYQNLLGLMAPQKQEDGTLGWAVPIDPTVRGIHMGDIRELGDIVAGAFAHPDQAGNGEYLPLVGDFMSFNEIVDTLNRQGHEFSFKQVPGEVFAKLFPGAAEIAATFAWFQAHTYLGSDSRDRIALANTSGRPATNQARHVGPGEFPSTRERLRPSAPISQPTAEETLMSNLTATTSRDMNTRTSHESPSNTVKNVSELIGRTLLSVLFLLSGVGKIGAYAATAAYMSSVGVPGVLLPVVIATEVLGALAIILGWHTRIAALLLAGYSLLAALIFHANFADQIQMIMFLKNVSIAGGFLLLVGNGAGPLSLDRRRASNGNEDPSRC